MDADLRIFPPPVTGEQTPNHQPWMRQPKEPDLWFDRFQRFLFLGVTRSIYQTYLAERREKAKTKKQRQCLAADVSARVGLPKQWRENAEKWDWKGRAHAWDEDQRKHRSELYAAQQDEILKRGFAAQVARIYELNRLAELLLAEIWTEDKRWLPDVKQIGSGDAAERVDIVRFNTGLIQQFRGTLEDIALEFGERGMKLETTMKHEITSDQMAAARARAKEYEQAKFGADALSPKADQLVRHDAAPHGDIGHG